jgi:hypothetical protein
MKIYRNDYRDRGQTNLGFSFHTNMAARAWRSKRSRRAQQEEQKAYRNHDRRWLDIELTKRDVLAALNLYAAHPGKSKPGNRRCMANTDTELKRAEPHFIVGRKGI